MNYYDDVIKLLESEQNWREIVFKIARKHPKHILDAVGFVSWEERAKVVYKAEGFIPSIRYCRNQTGVSLKEAKELVEKLTGHVR